MIKNGQACLDFLPENQSLRSPRNTWIWLWLYRKCLKILFSDWQKQLKNLQEVISWLWPAVLPLTAWQMANCLFLVCLKIYGSSLQLEMPVGPWEQLMLHGTYGKKKKELLRMKKMQ